jgi:carbon starvation protein CstA
MGVWYVLEPPEQLYGYLLIAFSICLYTGAFMSLRIVQKQAETEASATPTENNV